MIASKPGLLSVVVPTMNQGPFIEQSIRSILNQTYRNIEVIVQDSLSTDETESVCRRLSAEDPRLIYAREKDSGQSDALNRGLGKSNGEFWTWLCSDDLYEDQTALEQLIARLNEQEIAVGAYGDTRFVTEDLQPTRPHFSLNRDVRLEDYRLSWPVAQPSLVLRRYCVADVGGIDPKLHLGMDLDLFLKILKRFPHSFFAYVPVNTAIIREHRGSKTTSLAVATMVQAMSLLRKHFGLGIYLFRSIYFKYWIKLKVSNVKTCFMNR